ncbi:MAG: glutamate racemase [Brevinematales bacterium]|nr:glutamate racemase [Brevinematales bacterium]
MDRRPIGVFDSGVGGLTVLNQIRRLLPRESIIYLGDTKHLPYGDKSEEAIIRFSIQNSKFLVSKNVKAIVIACNSASSVAVPALKQMFDLPIIDVIEPTVEFVANNPPSSILIIGTIRTVKSGVFASKVSSVDKGIKVFSKACPLFVPLVEEGAFIDKNSYIYLSLENAIKHYLSEFKGKIDSLIMGCTHYPLIEREINEFMGNINMIDPGRCAAMKLKGVLESMNLLSDGIGRFEEFFVTDLSERTKQVSEIILGNNINIEEVHISEL